MSKDVMDYHISDLKENCNEFISFFKDITSFKDFKSLNDLYVSKANELFKEISKTWRQVNKAYWDTK